MPAALGRSIRIEAQPTRLPRGSEMAPLIDMQAQLLLGSCVVWGANTCPVIEEARNKYHKRSELKRKVSPELGVLNRESSGGESQVEHLQQPIRISSESWRAKVRWLGGLRHLRAQGRGTERDHKNSSMLIVTGQLCREEHKSGGTEGARMSTLITLWTERDTAFSGQCVTRCSTQM